MSNRKPLLSATYNDLVAAPVSGGLSSFAVLVVDVQEFFCSTYRVPQKNAGTPATELAADRIAAFLPQLERLGIPAVWIYSGHKEGIANSPFGDFYKARPSNSDRSHLILKFDNNSFAGTVLDVRLKEMNVHNLIIVGVNFEACVKATALAARDKGYNVVIPMECTANNILNTQGAISRTQQEPYAKKGVVMTDGASLLRYLPGLTP